MIPLKGEHALMDETASDPSAGLPDFIHLGAIADRFPLETVQEVLEQTGRQSQRQRNLPAHVMVYYVMALALHMHLSCSQVLRQLVEALSWLELPVQALRMTGRSGISQARERLGAEPLKRLYEETVQPLATPETRGAWYGPYRLVGLDGTTLDLADTPANDEVFGRPGASRGQSGFPQVRLVSLVETGTRVLFGSYFGPYSTAEVHLAGQCVEHLSAGMLCLADRGFMGYALWSQSLATGADLLWRAKNNQVFVVQERLEDGSYLSQIYPSSKHRQRDEDGLLVRIVEYTLEVEGTRQPGVYRLMTTLLDPQQAPAQQLAQLYHERWEVETTFQEFKTILRGAKTTLRSKKPELVKQELYGLLLAHFAIRGLIHEAALQEGLDPDTLSFSHTVQVVRRKLPAFVFFPPSGLSLPPSTGLDRDS
jgi:hypothetical protein